MKRMMPERICFIGNSLTYYHDMPKTVSALCKVAGKNVTVDSATYPAANACQQASTEHEVGQKVHELMKKTWDVVVLQPSRILNPRSPEVNEQMRLALLKLNEMARNAGAQPVLYCSWGNNTGCHNIHRMKENGYDTELIDSFPVTREEHNVYMRKICAEYSEMIDAPVVDCATLMEKMIVALPDVPMIMPDNRHPTNEASFGIACAFYDFFFGEPSADPADTVETDIDRNYAKILSRVADDWILRGV